MSWDNLGRVGNFSGFGGSKAPAAISCERFNLASLHDRGSFWVSNEVIVALGSDVSRKSALNVLRHVIKRLEFEIEQG